MDKTPFSKKCEVITDFSEMYADAEWAADYFSFYNLGIPWAIGAHYNDLTLNDNGIFYVEQAWTGLLNLLGVDSYGEYDSLSTLMEIANEQG